VALFSTAGTATTLPSAGTTATIVFDPSWGQFTSGVTLKDVTLVNSGGNLCWVGQSTVSITTGLPLAVGAQLTIQGFTATGGQTAGRIYAIAGAGTATTVLADLATLASVA
jgi:hypothetical protein